VAGWGVEADAPGADCAAAASPASGLTPGAAAPAAVAAAVAGAMAGDGASGAAPGAVVGAVGWAGVAWPGGCATAGDTAVAGLAPTAGCWPVAGTARALIGTLRGTGLTDWLGCAGVPGCCRRAAASALTRCSSSAARSGARPAQLRRRLSSRACEKTSSERIAIPSSAANAAIAPAFVNSLESESASGVAVMNPESV
jgi:hypothetical protein